MNRLVFILIFLFCTFSRLNLFCSWYKDWKYRISITNTFADSGDLTNFPVLIYITNNAGLIRSASDNGYDIVFTLKDGAIKLDHEIEYFNKNEGLLYAWVRMPILSAAVQYSNIIYMYYGTAKIENNQNSDGTWSNSYYGVWHLQEDPSANAPQIKDSTGNGYHGSSVNSPVSKSGILQNCVEFSDISGSAIEFNTINSEEISIETWVYYYSNNNYRGDYSCGLVFARKWSAIPAEGQGYDLYFPFANDETLTFSLYTTGPGGPETGSAEKNLGNPAAYSNWYYFCATYNKASGEAKVYVNGKSENIYNFTAGNTIVPYSANSTIYTGRTRVNSGSLNGLIDETRISSVPRSENWFKTSFTNMVNPEAFRNLGTEETNGAVYINSFTTTEIVKNETAYFNAEIEVLTGGITNIIIDFGNDVYYSINPPSETNVSLSMIPYTYSEVQNCLATITAQADTGYAASKSLVVSVKPYRMYHAQNVFLSNQPEGILLQWDMYSAANISAYAIYKNGSMLTTITKDLSSSRYLDELVPYGTTAKYCINTIYPVGLTISVTNVSKAHDQYLIEKEIGSSGGVVANLMAKLIIPENTLSSTEKFIISVLSNNYYCFYAKGNPVFNQVAISIEKSNVVFLKPMILIFKIPVTNNRLIFKDAIAPPLSVSDKNALTLAKWDENDTWHEQYTVSRVEKRTAEFSYLLLEIPMNSIGIFGVIQYSQKPLNTELKIINKVFWPISGRPNLSRTIISFPNIEKENAAICIFNLAGKKVYSMQYNSWISSFSWDGKDYRGQIADSGLYIITIMLGGNKDSLLRSTVYLNK